MRSDVGEGIRFARVRNSKQWWTGVCGRSRMPGLKSKGCDLEVGGWKLRNMLIEGDTNRAVWLCVLGNSGIQVGTVRTSYIGPLVGTVPK